MAKRINKQETTKAVTLSLTPTEEEDLNTISKNLLGASNKSGIVRYWINKYKRKCDD